MVSLTDLRGTITGVDSAPTISLIQNTVDGAYVQARQVDVFRDSAFITNLIDSDRIMGVVNTSDIVPLADSSLSLGDSNRKFKELYLSSGTLHLGDKPFRKKDILDFDMSIEPETMTISADMVGAGGSPDWLWSWDVTSNIPYARTRIRNLAQANVPLYHAGSYTVHNFGAHSLNGNMTQTHKLYLKWIDGAGTQNIPSWSSSTLNVPNISMTEVRGGTPTTVQRLNINVPAEGVGTPTLTPPTLTYNVAAAGGQYVFSGIATGANVSLGPLYRGGTYTFDLDSSINGHPFYLSTDSAGAPYTSGGYTNEYTDGVTNSRSQGPGNSQGDLVFTVPSDAPSSLIYRCGIHAGMVGNITIKDLKLDSTGTGNPILYFQHDQEMHKTPVEIRPIPAASSQMCLTFDGTKFVPQDMNVYLQKTPIMRDAVKEQAAEQITTEINAGSIASPTGIKDTIVQSTNLSQQGDLTIVQGTARWYAPFSLQMLQVVPRLGTAADAAVGIVIEKNDSDHTTFQFGAGVTEVILDSSNNIPFNMTESDYLTVDVTSIGNTNKGKDLIVQFRYKAT